MTDVVFYTKDNIIYSVECSGHTGYADAGEDIVCSALSSMVQSCALGLSKVVGAKPKLKINEERGYYKIDLPKDLADAKMHDSQILLKTLYLSVADLVQGYSRYIKLEERDYVY